MNLPQVSRKELEKMIFFHIITSSNDGATSPSLTVRIYVKVRQKKVGDVKIKKIQPLMFRRYEGSCLYVLCLWLP